MDVEELSKLTRSKPEEVKKALEDLKFKYDSDDSSTMLVNEGDVWRITVRQQYLSLVEKIVTQTEISKTILETLAVIAFKYPIKQSELIQLRTNKAYDHLKELEELGYITRQKYGRTNLIKLTQKFFEYFDLPEGKLKEVFQDFGSIAKAIETKETEIKSIMAEQKRSAEEDKQNQNNMEQGIGLDDDSDVETYTGSEELEVVGEKLGNLDVVDEPTEEIIDKENKRIEKLKEKDKEIAEENSNSKKSIGIKTNKEMDKLIEEKAEEIIHPKPENADEENTENQDSVNTEEKLEEESDKSEQPEDEGSKDLIEAAMEAEKKQEESSKKGKTKKATKKSS